MIDPSLFATVNDIQRLCDLYRAEGFEIHPDAIARREQAHRYRAAYALWESELAEKYRDRAIPEGFEEMETFPYEEFADATDRQRLEQIKNEYGVVDRTKRTTIRPHQVLGMISHRLLGRDRSLRSIFVESPDWGVWEGTGPWVGWSRPLWRSLSTREQLCLFPDTWQVWEMAAVSRQWRAQLVAAQLTASELVTLAARLPSVST